MIGPMFVVLVTVLLCSRPGRFDFYGILITNFMFM